MVATIQAPNIVEFKEALKKKPLGGKKLPKNEVDRIMRRHRQLIAKKRFWLDHYQIIGEFIHTRKQEFTSEQEPGEFLNRELFDSLGPKSAKIAASAFVSMLWPKGTKRRLRLNPPSDLEQTKEVKEYYEFASETILGVLDNPRSGFSTSFDEYMLDQIVFGTSGIEISRDRETKLSYRPWGVKHLSLDQGKNGFVDTLYIEVSLSVHEIVGQYGEENVSAVVRKQFNDGQLDKEHSILIAIEPRTSKTFNKKGVDAKPFISKHIELRQKHMLLESGFDEMPVKVGRFTKILGEKYGRSPAMDALADILESNAIWEAVIIAIEKTLDPPLAVLDDGKLGGGEIDTSAGAINVFNLSGRAGEKNPIFPLFTVGEIKQVVNLLEQLGQSISDHFFIDRLLDFNNETRMTLGEANIRNRLRNATLGSIFSRQIAEVIEPIVVGTFNNLLDMGELGVIAGSVEADIAELEGEEVRFIPKPVVDLILAGRDVYDIEYFTPALRIMQAEEAEGIIRTYEMAEQIVKTGDESVVDNLDGDDAIRKFSELTGAPSTMLKAQVDVDEKRKKDAELAERKLRVEEAQAVSDAARNIGQSGLVPTQAPQQAA